VPTAIPSELHAFLESGITILVGSRDARLVPESVRGVGAKIARDGTELTIWIPAVTAARTLANVADNGRLAVYFCSIDHRSFQFKGRVTSTREARPKERAELERYRAALAQLWGNIGVPPRLTHRMVVWPAHAVTMQVESVFVQTPGPGAGAALDEVRRGKKSGVLGAVQRKEQA
jgi:pyridoxamine 5'-phosphate oxidase-like protein